MTIDSDSVPVFDFSEYLESDDFVSRYNRNKLQSIIFRTSGSLSTIASTCIIVHILRSHHGLSTAYHRLVFGLSIGDVLASFFGYVLDSTMAPKELDYVVPFAMGNQATCDAQGFLLTSGAGIALSYNSSICLYYLAIVTFNKTDGYIRTKLEPWLHGISLSIPLILPSMILAINGFNSEGGVCWFTPNREIHCAGLESGEIREGFTIPCGRGDGKENPALRQVLETFMICHIFLTPAVIVVTMALMYRTVYNVERKMRKYGVGALRLREERRNSYASAFSGIAPNGNSNGTPPDAGDSKRILVQWLKSKICCINSSCIAGGRSPISRSNTASSQKRSILHRAAGYVFAWAVSWIPWFLAVTRTSGVFMVYVNAIFLPLQGFFNFIVFMYPKVISAKQGRSTRRRRSSSGTSNDGVGEVSWYQAFVKAYISRGERRRRVSLHSCSSMRSSRHSSTTSNNSVSVKNYLRSVLKKLRTSKKSSSTFSARSLISLKARSSGIDDRAANKQQQQVPVCPFSSAREGKDINLVGDAPYGNDNEESSPTSLQTSCNNVILPLAEENNSLKEETKGEIHHFNSANKVDHAVGNDEDLKLAKKFSYDLDHSSFRLEP